MDIAFDLVPQGPKRGRPKGSTGVCRHDALIARVLAGEHPASVASAAGMDLKKFQDALSRARRRGVKIPKFHRRYDDGARTADILRRSRDGETLESIGKRYGISRERVRQICVRAGLPSEDRGMFLMTRKRRAARAAARDARYMAWYGVPFAQLCTLRQIGAVKAFQNQRRTQRGTLGLPWTLSLRDWWLVWHESGKWDQRGRGRYGMSCYDKALGFVPGNVFIGAPADYMPYRSVSAVSHAPAQAAS